VARRQEALPYEQDLLKDSAACKMGKIVSSISLWRDIISNFETRIYSGNKCQSNSAFLAANASETETQTESREGILGIAASFPELQCSHYTLHDSGLVWKKSNNIIEGSLCYT